MKHHLTDRLPRLRAQIEPAVPAVWSQLDPARQRQFAQGLAQLLLRYRQQQSAQQKEDQHHDPR